MEKSKKRWLVSPPGAVAVCVVQKTTGLARLTEENDYSKPAPFTGYVPSAAQVFCFNARLDWRFPEPIKSN